MTNTKENNYGDGMNQQTVQNSRIEKNLYFSQRKQLLNTKLLLEVKLKNLAKTLI